MDAQTLLLLSYMLIFASGLTFVALGGMFSERSGVMNIGLEGIMVVGGFCGILTLNGLQDAGCPDALTVILTILVAMASGMVYSLLLALASVTLKANQTLVGTAMNLIATALVTIIATKLTAEGGSSSLRFDNSPFVISVTSTFTLNIFIFLAAVLAIASYLILSKTRFGLRLRACGENPGAADSVGINVAKYRYAGVLVSGALAGLGALAYLLPIQSVWDTQVGVSGFGFLALAIMIFGSWKPIRIFFISLVFSFFLSLSYVYMGIFEAFFGVTLTSANGVTAELFKMLPFVASLILLAFTSKKSRGPKSVGIPYDKEHISG